MKFLKFITISLFFVNHFCFTNFSELPEPVPGQKPLLVVLIMVKNEQAVMEKTLQPFFQAGLQHYVILDTGSTDGTVKLTRQLFKKYNISNGHVIEKPFVSFAVSRNYAIRSAEHIFPGAKFFLMIDAEWYFNNVNGLLDFCEKNKNNESDAFFIKRVIKQYSSSDIVSWLFRAHAGVKFFGAVHECINKKADIMLPEDVFIVYDPSDYGKGKTSERLHRDVNLLLKEHEENPRNLRTFFYLGQTYSCLKDYKKAIYWYSKRCTNIRYDEENYMAHYRLGLLYGLSKMWPEAISYFCRATYIIPSRIDALASMAQHFAENKNYDCAFLLAKKATEIQLPSLIFFMVESRMVNFLRYSILAESAWHLGEYEVGLASSMDGIEKNPNNQKLMSMAFVLDGAINHSSCSALDRSKWCDWCNGKLWMSRASWLNFACLSNASYRSNRCNGSGGIAWRNWF
ncbi:MAG: hypothetical protein NTU89_02450 [Candidatus Dependentiae bacterium]|nr:hypothetical protein [Candidatus Dependentiae bacterium]